MIGVDKPDSVIRQLAESDHLSGTIVANSLGAVQS